MPFENETEQHMLAWLETESKGVSEMVLSGGCITLEEYRERCGRLRAFWDVQQQLAEARRKRHGNQPLTDTQEGMYDV